LALAASAVLFAAITPADGEPNQRRALAADRNDVGRELTPGGEDHASYLAYWLKVWKADKRAASHTQGRPLPARRAAASGRRRKQHVGAYCACGTRRKMPQLGIISLI
jgi:hypothetical protein